MKVQKCFFCDRIVGNLKCYPYNGKPYSQNIKYFNISFPNKRIICYSCYDHLIKNFIRKNCTIKEIEEVINKKIVQALHYSSNRERIEFRDNIEKEVKDFRNFRKYINEEINLLWLELNRKEAYEARKNKVNI